MGKLNSGRVKRTPQIGITSDRYEFLGLRQAEPNLGDPLVGPSSVGANPIPIGSYYQLSAIGEKVGERYWTTPVGIGTTIGVITVFDDGFLPNNAFQKIHGLNFVGAGVTVEVPSIDFIGDVGIATIRIAVNDILNQGDIGQILFNTTAGVVGGASEFYYNPITNNVGIGSSLPSEKLDIDGTIRTEDIKIEGTLIAQGSSGLSGQYLKSTATGLEWDYIPQTLRVGFTTIASVSQSVFEFNYNPDIIDVFVNGVRLNANELVAENGTTITLNNACFGGELIDIITYEYLNISTIIANQYWIETPVGIHTLSNVGIGTTNPTSALDVDGTIQATLFVGDGSGLTGVVGTGSGVEIRSNDSPVGTAATINFADNLTVEFSSGIATITSTGGTLGIATDSQRLEGELPSYYLDYDNFTNTPTIPTNLSELNDNVGFSTFSGDYEDLTNAPENLSDFSNDVGFITSFTDTNYWEQTTSGIHTLSNVGIGTTNPTSALTVKGNTSFLGISTFGSATDGTISGSIDIVSTVSSTNISPGAITLNGGVSSIQRLGDQIRFRSGQNGTSSYYFSNYFGGFDNEIFFIGTNGNIRTSGSANISGVTTTQSLNVGTGGTTITTTLDGLVGIGTTNPTSALTVKGNTSLETLIVSGVSTLSTNVSVGGTISIDGGVTLATNNVTIVGTSATEGEIKRIGGAPFFYDGSAWREFVLSSGTPVTIPADTEWDSVIFRATFDEDFTDSKFGVSPVFVSDGSSIVGAAVTIGTGAYRNDGSVGAGISYAYRDEYDFTGSWTIEFWIYHDSPSFAYNSLVSQVSTTDGSGNWTLGIYDTGNSAIWYWNNENNNSGNRQIYSTSSGVFDNNFIDKWNHYALVREGNTGALHFYVNGIESINTITNAVIDNDILQINGAGLYIGSPGITTINGTTWNSSTSIDAIFDDMRISAGVGSAGQRYTSVGINTIPTFTPPTTELPVTGTLSSYVQPPGDKYGEIGLGTSPTWRGTSGVTVTQQSSGNYRVSFASSYTNSNDYFVLSQAMDQGFASYVGVARSTTHVDFSINKESDDTAVDTGSLSVQINNHN